MQLFAATVGENQTETPIHHPTRQLIGSRQRFVRREIYVVYCGFFLSCTQDEGGEWDYGRIWGDEKGEYGGMVRPSQQNVAEGNSF